MSRERQPHTFLQLRFGQRDDVVELALQNVERQIEGDARGQPFGERCRPVADDPFGAPPRSREASASAA